MAAGTVQSFNTLNYSGLLYNKSDERTPFLNLISGNVKYTNSVKFVCGQYYNSEEGDIPAISETASLTAPSATYVTRTQFTNLTQIFQETVAISYAKMSNMGTLSGANLAGQIANPQNELDFQVAQKMKKVRRSIEKTFIQGVKNEATKDSEINKTAGINSGITTNVIAASSKALDMWLLNSAVEEILNNGGDISNLYVLCNTVNLYQVNGNAIEMGMKIGEAYASEYGIQVRDVILPIGATVHIVVGAFIPEGTAFIINPSVMGPVEQPVPGKGNFFLEPLAKSGAGETYQIFGQIGLDFGPEWFSAKITGLSTTFTAPQGQKVVTVASA